MDPGLSGAGAVGEGEDVAHWSVDAASAVVVVVVGDVAEA